MEYLNALSVLNKLGLIDKGEYERYIGHEKESGVSVTLRDKIMNIFVNKPVNENYNSSASESADKIVKQIVEKEYVRYLETKVLDSTGLAEKDKEIAALEAKIKPLEAEVAKLNTDNLSKDAQISALQSTTSTTSAANAIATAVTAAIGPLNQTIADQIADLNQKDQEIKKLKDTESIINQELAKREATIAAQEQEIKRLTTDNSTKTVDIQQKDQLIEKQKQEIEQKDKELNARKKVIEQKDQEIENQKQLIAQKISTPAPIPTSAVDEYKLTQEIKKEITKEYEENIKRLKEGYDLNIEEVTLRLTQEKELLESEIHSLTQEIKKQKEINLQTRKEKEEEIEKIEQRLQKTAASVFQQIESKMPKRTPISPLNKDLIRQISQEEGDGDEQYTDRTANEMTIRKLKAQIEELKKQIEELKNPDFTQQEKTKLTDRNVELSREKEKLEAKVKDLELTISEHNHGKSTAERNFDEYKKIFKLIDTPNGDDVNLKKLEYITSNSLEIREFRKTVQSINEKIRENIKLKEENAELLKENNEIKDKLTHAELGLKVYKHTKDMANLNPDDGSAVEYFNKTIVTEPDEYVKFIAQSVFQRLYPSIEVISGGGKRTISGGGDPKETATNYIIIVVMVIIFILLLIYCFIARINMNCSPIQVIPVQQDIDIKLVQ